MEDYTRKFNAAKEKDEEIHHILTSVYTALEEEGSYVDLTFKVLACSDGELYKKFRVKAADWAAQAGA